MKLFEINSNSDRYFRTTLYKRQMVHQLIKMPEQLFMDSFPMAQPITHQKFQPVGMNNEGFKKTASEPNSEQAPEPGSEQASESAS